MSDGFGQGPKKETVYSGPTPGMDNKAFAQGPAPATTGTVYRPFVHARDGIWWTFIYYYKRGKGTGAEQNGSRRTQERQLVFLHCRTLFGQFVCCHEQRCQLAVRHRAGH